MATDRELMTAALDAAMIAPFTSPNPRVGAVVARDGVVLGTGTHMGVGTSHAEVDALGGIDARGADLFVTLEPCGHEGRTPPCVDAIVAAGIRRVVVAIEDPDPRVSGRGISSLREQGIDVIVGPGETRTRAQIAAYVHQRTTGRPLVTLKLALTLDGRLAAADGSSRWVTGYFSRQRVHKRRCETDALLVGSGTVLADDPELNVRDVEGPVRQPAVILADGRGRVPATARLFAAGDREVIVGTTSLAPHDRQTEWKEAGAEVIVLPVGPGGSGVDLAALIDALSARDWLEITAEGGAELATALLRDGIARRVEIYRGPKVTGAGPMIGPLGVGTMSEALVFRTSVVEKLGDDVLTVLEVEGPVGTAPPGVEGESPSATGIILSASGRNR